MHTLGSGNGGFLPLKISRNCILGEVYECETDWALIYSLIIKTILILFIGNQLIYSIDSIHRIIIKYNISKLINLSDYYYYCLIINK